MTTDRKDDIETEHSRPLGPRDPRCCLTCRLDYGVKIALDTFYAMPDKRRAFQKLALSAAEWMVERAREAFLISDAMDPSDERTRQETLQ